MVWPMRFRSVVRVVPVAFAALFATACIEDPTLVEEEGAPALSEDEIEFLGLTPLLKALEGAESAEDSAAIALGRGGARPSSGASGPARAPVAFDEMVSTVVPCEGGGDVDVSVELAGTYDDETGAADMVFTMILTPELCQESSNGFDVTLFGDPNITVIVGFITEGDGVLDIEGSFAGGIAALTDGRVAECFLDVSFSGTESETSGTTLDIEGEVCGRSVSRRLESHET